MELHVRTATAFHISFSESLDRSVNASTYIKSWRCISQIYTAFGKHHWIYLFIFILKYMIHQIQSTEILSNLSKHNSNWTLKWMTKLTTLMFLYKQQRIFKNFVLMSLHWLHELFKRPLNLWTNSTVNEYFM